MRYTTGHDKRLREARRADALAAELIRTREHRDALADALRTMRERAQRRSYWTRRTRNVCWPVLAFTLGLFVLIVTVLVELAPQVVFILIGTLVLVYGVLLIADHLREEEQ